VVHRKRSLTRNQEAGRKSSNSERETPQTIRILHADDNELVAGTVKEVLKLEGWEVETCSNGIAAMERIASQARFDLLLLDYDLPGVNGMQLVQHAHSLAHRRQTPIVILSATIDAADANLAGANGFLRKPEDICKVAETITRLVRSAKN
jgi:CheY-like chemotaxis protein